MITHAKNMFDIGEQCSYYEGTNTEERQMPFELFIILVVAAMCFVAAYRAD